MTHFLPFPSGHAHRALPSRPKGAVLDGWMDRQTDRRQTDIDICDIMTLSLRKAKWHSLSNSQTNILLLEERTEVTIELTSGG